DSYAVNYKILLKKIEEDLNIWKNNLCLLIERPNIVKIPAFLKLIYRFNAIPIKFPPDFEDTILKSWSTYIPDIKVDYKVTVIERVCWCRDREIGQWNRIGSPKKDPYSQLI
ncbi:LORF2 protein, partial [Crocuta crocuta]